MTHVASPRTVENIHALPAIAHYWGNRFLLPIWSKFGFQSTQQFFVKYATSVCNRKLNKTCRFVSLGAGNGEVEVALAVDLRDAGYDNFTLEVLDESPDAIRHGKSLAVLQNVADNLFFTQGTLSDAVMDQPYDLILAYHKLHRHLALEEVFQTVHDTLEEDGYFLVHDMIGRNGLMRWPEVMEVINGLWHDLSDRYKYNHQLKRLELEYENWDCSAESLDGIRSQDILPLLVEMFNFDMIVPWGGILDIFIDRNFGHNFDPNEPWDCAFINMVHALNVEKTVDGTIKPTQMIAAMTKQPVPHPHYYLGMTPEFCLRKPDE